ncbi:MAG: 3D-(3,5/4)-trihydroxycyclohexane-1,2-dione acylhydrolase (decyclizing), partial [Mobilicoccus sp.]|nr:3D-(3,5/4)-trihydroxycyclohexane-1,2-dione acylhydrolase (decyclizing) [Mobilicoccus sp.]
GATVLRCDGIADFRDKYRQATGMSGVRVLYIETDLTGPNPPASAYWDVPVPEVSELESTRAAREQYDDELATQRHYL